MRRINIRAFADAAALRCPKTMKKNAARILVPAAFAVGIALLTAVSQQGPRESAPNCYQGPAGARVRIPAGELAMGSDRHYPEEAPISRVAVAAFDMDIHEVTNDQFRRFVDQTGYVTSAERAQELGFDADGSAVFRDGGWSFVAGANWRHPEGPRSTIEGRGREPVVQVSFDDARAYAEWAGRSLPSEAEWEYAARAGLEGAQYAWGDDRVPGGVHRANTWQGHFPGNNLAEDGYAGRAPVGCFRPDDYGLYDMIGNVWEWTAGPYHAPRRAEGDAERDPTGLDPRQPGVPVGVIKGGSFLCAENYCRRYRPAARHPQDTQLGTNHLGFRTVRRADTNRP